VGESVDSGDELGRDQNKHGYLEMILEGGVE